MNNLFLAVVFSVATFWPSTAFSEPYQDRVHEFSIAFPEGWTVKRSSNRETIIKAVYRDRLDQIAQITIAAYLLPGEISDKDTATLTADDMWKRFKEQYPDFTVKRHDSGTAKIRSHRAAWNLIEITDPPQAKSIAKHYHFVRGKYLYRITAVSDSGAAFFKELLPTMDKSISTLAFGL